MWEVVISHSARLLGVSNKINQWKRRAGGAQLQYFNRIGSPPLFTTPISIKPRLWDNRAARGVKNRHFLVYGAPQIRTNPTRKKNSNWIYWVQGVWLNEILPSFVFWFGRMMYRFLHENPLYTFCSLSFVVLFSVCFVVSPQFLSI